MALLKELTEYRSKIMKELCSNQKIVDLLRNEIDSSLPDRTLMYTQIFPYAFTPEKTEDVKTYICFRVYVPEVFNKTVKKMGIVFYVFTHQNLIRTEDGLRPDLIAEEIEKLFNGSLKLGAGRLAIEGLDDISPASGFHGIALEYSVTEFNRPTVHGRR